MNRLRRSRRQLRQRLEDPPDPPRQYSLGSLLLLLAVAMGVFAFLRVEGCV